MKSKHNSSNAHMDSEETHSANVAKRKSKAITVGSFRLPKQAGLNKLHLSVFGLIFAGIGAYLIFQSSAATLPSVLEVENGTVNSPASIITDATASGGKAVQFGTGSCPETTPNTPDGPDPFGGCFPGPKTTGVPDGTTLTNYTGPCTVTTANTVIDSKTINCDLTIKAANVQITKSYINGRVWIDDPTPNYSFTVSDSTIDAGPVDAVNNDGKSAIGKSHFVATRVETFRGIRGVWCEYDCTVRDSWIHGQDKDEGGAAHQSGVRLGSGCGASLSNCPAGDYPKILGDQKVIHNTIICDAPNVPPDGGCSANITGYGDFAPIQNNTVDKNLLLATTGGTCAYGGSSGMNTNPPKPYANKANNVVFTNNIFQKRSAVQSSGKCGVWFPISDFYSNLPGNVWTNNKWDDGTTVPPDH